MDPLIPVNILIGDRSYRIKLAPQDEEHVRKTVKLINEKILEFKTGFAGKDMQDYVAMVLVWYATQATSGSTGTNGLKQDSSALGSLKKIEDQLDELLNAKE